MKRIYTKADKDFMHRLHQKHYKGKKEDPVEAKLHTLKQKRIDAPVKKDRLAELDKNCAKYPQYVKGSVRKSSEGVKFEAQIKCKCGKTRWVFTQDLFQIKLCVECKKAEVAAKRKKARK